MVQSPKNEQQRSSPRKWSYPGAVLVISGVGLLGAYAILAYLNTTSLESIKALVALIPMIDTWLYPAIGVCLLAVGIGFEVWDARRTWHRPMWRVRQELETALRMMNITTVSTIDSASPTEGLVIDRYRWRQSSFSVTVHLAQPGNARMTLESLQQLAKAAPFRFAHSCEVELCLKGRHNSPDGFLIHIFYRDTSETIDRQLEGGAPWQTS